MNKRAEFIKGSEETEKIMEYGSKLSNPIAGKEQHNQYCQLQGLVKTDVCLDTPVEFEDTPCDKNTEGGEKEI